MVNFRHKMPAKYIGGNHGNTESFNFEVDKTKAFST